ncbi:hypothetical protein A2U01_0069443, partial [Trifolium medium]|nr:hypothetical protein [Trifolium medium]
EWRSGGKCGRSNLLKQLPYDRAQAIISTSPL